MLNHPQVLYITKLLGIPFSSKNVSSLRLPMSQGRLFVKPIIGIAPTWFPLTNPLCSTSTQALCTARNRHLPCLTSRIAEKIQTPWSSWVRWNIESCTAIDPMSILRGLLTILLSPKTNVWRVNVWTRFSSFTVNRKVE